MLWFFKKLFDALKFTNLLQMYILLPNTENLSFLIYSTSTSIKRQLAKLRNDSAKYERKILRDCYNKKLNY